MEPHRTTSLVSPCGSVQCRVHKGSRRHHASQAGRRFELTASLRQWDRVPTSRRRQPSECASLTTRTATLQCRRCIRPPAVGEPRHLAGPRFAHGRCSPSRPVAHDRCSLRSHCPAVRTDITLFESHGPGVYLCVASVYGYRRRPNQVRSCCMTGVELVHGFDCRARSNAPSAWSMEQRVPVAFLLRRRKSPRLWGGRTNVRLSIVGVVALSPLLLSACSASDNDPAAALETPIESIYTDLGAGSCRKEIDKADPNETTLPAYVPALRATR